MRRFIFVASRMRLRLAAIAASLTAEPRFAADRLGYALAELIALSFFWVEVSNLYLMTRVRLTLI